MRDGRVFGVLLDADSTLRFCNVSREKLSRTIDLYICDLEGYASLAITLKRTKI